MRIRLFNLDEFGCLYKSLVTLCGYGIEEAQYLTYFLNTANIDTAKALGIMPITESCMERFFYEIQRRGFPYQSMTKLFIALEVLEKNILPENITEDQYDALQEILSIQDNVINIFQENYGVEISDCKKTTYGECVQNMRSYPYEPMWSLKPCASFANAE